MNKTVAKLIAVLLFTSIITAQDNKPADKTAQPPTFRADTQLVLIPTVVSKGGAPVTGLKKENFLVEEDGKARTIALFEEVTPASTAARHMKRARGAIEFSNETATDIPQAMTLIAIDGINTPAMNQEQARKQVLGFMAKNATGSQVLGVVVLTNKGIKLVQDFTADSRLLVAALEKVSGQNNRFNAGHKPGVEQQNIATSAAPPGAIDVADVTRLEGGIDGGRPGGPPIAQDSYDQSLQHIESALVNFVRADAKAQEYQLAEIINSSLEGFQQIAQGLAAYPGKKNVVWMSAGFVYPLDIRAFQEHKYLMDQYTRTLKMLSDANVAVYPVDVHGIQFIAGADTTYTREDSWAGVDKYSSYKNASLRLDTFRDFAERTGGRVFFDPNDNQKAFEEILSDTRSYYMIGYYLNRSEIKPGWRKLKVKLQSADGRVQARSGFYAVATPSDPEQIRKTDLLVATRAPFDYTGLPIRAMWVGSPSPEGAKRKVPFEIRVMPSAQVIASGDQPTINLEFISVARKTTTDIAGQTAKSVSMKLQPQAVELISREGIAYKGMLQLDPGQYSVRFLVRDNISGRMGSVEAPLTVQ